MVSQNTELISFIFELSRLILFNKNKTHIVKDPKDALKSYKTFPKSTNIIIAGSHYLGPFISTEFKISFDNI